jgi:hypothetical protein
MLKYIIKANMTYLKQICHIFENDNKKPPAHNRRGVEVTCLALCSFPLVGHAAGRADHQSGT